MDNEKTPDFGEDIKGEESEPRESSPRARNRTVMLTPEITGEVRARLAQEMHSGGPLGLGTETPPPAPAAPVYPQAHGAAPAHLEQRGRRPAGAAVRPTPAPAPVVEKSDRVVWSKESPLIGFLISYDRNPNGDVFELRSGRLIVTSDVAGGGDFLIVQDDSVSPMHAILRMSPDGDIQVLDQLSEHGTLIQHTNGEEEQLSGDKSNIEHGDIVRFGKRKFYVCVVPKRDE